MQVMRPPSGFGTIHLKQTYNWCNPANQQLYEPYTAKCSLQYDEYMLLRFQFAHPQKTTSVYWKIPFLMNEDEACKTPYFQEFDIFKIEVRKYIIQGMITAYDASHDYHEYWEFIAEIKANHMPDFIHYWDVSM